MSISPRSALNNVEAFPDSIVDRNSCIRLDFNENTAGLQGLRFELPDIAKLSTYPHYGPLLTRLAEMFGVETDQIMISTGSDEAFPAICSTFIEPGKDVAVIAAPTFSVIRQSLVLADARLDEVPVLPSLEFDVVALEQAISRRPKLVILPVPDNPTGALLAPQEILRWTEEFPDIVFVIDEAYYEYAGITVLEMVNRRSNLLVMRTFSKAWGLAALRVGVTVGPSGLIALLKKTRLPFPVSALSAELVLQATYLQKDVHNAAAETMKRKASIVAALRSRRFDLVEGGGNFYLLRMGTRAAAFCSHLRERRILVRNISRGQQAEENCLYGCVRVAVGTENENALLLQAIDSFSSA